ncbi:MAG: hypothetical protein R3E79_01025 [Caldilineaceae bacterium]
MEATMKGLYALRKLRQELQDDAGLEFPQAIHTEMLVLYDVCRYLDFNLFQCKAVLGEIGWRYIHTYLAGKVTINERLHSR